MGESRLNRGLRDRVRHILSIEKRKMDSFGIYVNLLALLILCWQPLVAQPSRNEREREREEERGGQFAGSFDILQGFPRSDKDIHKIQ